MHRRYFLGSMLGVAACGTPLARTIAAAAATPVAGDLPATRLGGGETVLTRAAVKDFKASLGGPLIMPGDDGYDRARRVWNGMIDRRPALIARCSGAADVVRSVEFARANDLLVAVRSGGHSSSGQSVCDGGLMIDLSAMRGVRVDPRQKRAWVAGGSLLADLDRESQFFNLATTAGTVSHTGAAGLTLGGGFGRIGRRFGLSCDNLASLDVVTADGNVLRASSDENSDLFWAMRGGGGNFGIATGFEYRLHEVDRTVLGGSIMFPFSMARQVLDFYVEFSQTNSDELNLDCAIVAPPGGKPVVLLEACCIADPSKREKLVEPVRKFAKPLADEIKPMPYLALQTSGDEANGPGLNYYMKSGFVYDVDTALFDAAINGFTPDPGRATVMLFQQLGGAIGRVRNDATAFPHRKAQFDLLVMGAWADSAENDRHRTWVKSYWSALEPHTRGYYFNAQMGDSQAQVRANFGDNYPRLVKLKDRYDPGNLFRLNANVLPSATAS